MEILLRDIAVFSIRREQVERQPGLKAVFALLTSLIAFLRREPVLEDLENIRCSHQCPCFL